MKEDSVLAQLVITNEGQLSDRLGPRWSLNLLVHGIGYQIGPTIYAVDIADAARQFADTLGEDRT